MTARITLATQPHRIRLEPVGRSMTEADIRALLLRYGAIQAFVRPRDRETNRPLDFAVFEMQDPGASRAMNALNGRVTPGGVLALTAQVRDSPGMGAPRPPQAARLVETSEAETVLAG